MNRRKMTIFLAGLSILMLAAITVAGQLLSEAAMVTDFSRKNLAPCLSYPFGTDWMGRDMFVRTITGLSMSIRIGLLTAAISAVIAFLMGILAATMGKIADGLIIGLIDLVMGIPHILCTGKGILGCCDRNCADALDLPCTPDPRRGSAAEAEPVHKDSGKTGTGKAYHCVETYDASSDSAAVRWAGSDVSPCDPARSQHYISGLWTVSGTAGHRRHIVGKHEISRYGKMVARLFPGIVSGLCGAAVSFYGKYHQPAFGSGTRTSVKYPARVRWIRKRVRLARCSRE